MATTFGLRASTSLLRLATLASASDCATEMIVLGTIVQEMSIEQRACKYSVIGARTRMIKLRKNKKHTILEQCQKTCDCHCLRQCEMKLSEAALLSSSTSVLLEQEG